MNYIQDDWTTTLNLKSRNVTRFNTGTQSKYFSNLLFTTLVANCLLPYCQILGKNCLIKFLLQKKSRKCGKGMSLERLKVKQNTRNQQHSLTMNCTLLCQIYTSWQIFTARFTFGSGKCQLAILRGAMFDYSSIKTLLIWNSKSVASWEGFKSCNYFLLKYILTLLKYKVRNLRKHIFHQNGLFCNVGTLDGRNTFT